VVPLTQHMTTMPARHHALLPLRFISHSLSLL
jgi:hypothetical protein